jgi:hypothetical protein
VFTGYGRYNTVPTGWIYPCYFCRIKTHRYIIFMDAEVYTCPSCTNSIWNNVNCKMSCDIPRHTRSIKKHIRKTVLVDIRNSIMNIETKPYKRSVQTVSLKLSRVFKISHVKRTIYVSILYTSKPNFPVVRIDGKIIPTAKTLNILDKIPEIVSSKAIYPEYPAKDSVSLCCCLYYVINSINSRLKIRQSV